MYPHTKGDDTMESFGSDIVSTFYIIYLLSILVGAISPFIAAMIFAGEKFLWKDLKVFALAIFFCTILGGFPSLVFPTLHMQGHTSLHLFKSFVRIVPVLFLFFYFYKLKLYTASNAISLAIFASLARFISTFLANLMFNLFFDMPLNFQPSFIRLAAIAFSCLISAILAYISVKISAPLCKRISELPIMQTAIAAGAIINLSVFEVVFVSIAIADGDTSNLWRNVLIIGYIGATIACIFFYTNSITAKFKVIQQEAERANLLFYMDEIEKQQIAMRKFKHDQQNLFNTLDIFVHQKDWDGLSLFYPNVREASAIITKNEFTLEGLGKIKMREVKNILIAKFAMAQNLGISAKLEVSDEIDVVPVDPVILVRILGIILDNAIEELTSLGTGQFFISCFQIDGSINFVIKNTCRANMPTVRQLQQSGFSTKGASRGLGLSNLHELTSSLPNVILLTSIEDGQFTQTLIVGDKT